MGDKCEACGVKWVDHLGITGTCKKLQELKKYTKHLPNCFYNRPNPYGEDYKCNCGLAEVLADNKEK